MRRDILAVQLPADCPFACSFCRTPDHGIGDMAKVKAIAMGDLSEKAEVYLTSNGETGLAIGYEQLVNQIKLSTPVSVLCATPESVVGGLKRVEVSYNTCTKELALAAIKKAKGLDIPVAVSIIDDGLTEIPSLPSLADQLGVDGVVVRALQSEGLSKKQAGTSQVWTRPGVDLGEFPVAAYPELAQIGKEAKCINHWGKNVEFLGMAA